MSEEEMKDKVEEAVNSQSDAEKTDETVETQGSEADKAEEQKTEQPADEKKETSEEKSEEKEISPEEKIAALEKEIADLKNQALYKAAENDNWRKRMMQQKDDAVAYANASLLGDLLDSLDNFDRTIDAAKDAKDAKSIADGIKMINKSLVKMLEDKYGLAAYGNEGDDFDPEIHEAIGRMEDEKAKKETLAQVYLKGYKLKDKVIRLAKVMVKVPKA